MAKRKITYLRELGEEIKKDNHTVTMTDIARKARVSLAMMMATEMEERAMKIRNALYKDFPGVANVISDLLIQGVADPQETVCIKHDGEWRDVTTSFFFDSENEEFLQYWLEERILEAVQLYEGDIE